MEEQLRQLFCNFSVIKTRKRLTICSFGHIFPLFVFAQACELNADFIGLAIGFFDKKAKTHLLSDVYNLIAATDI